MAFVSQRISYRGPLVAALLGIAFGLAVGVSFALRS